MARGEPLIRQWNLLKILQSRHYGITSDDLAKELEYSKRQVLRDLKTLQQSGFPISFEERDYGKRYWKMSGKFIESQQLLLSITEILSLYMSQQLLSPLAGTSFGNGLVSLLEKVKTYLPKQALKYFTNLDQSFIVKNLAYHDYSQHEEQISLLNQSITESRILNIRYKSATKKQPYNTQFHPYGMIYFGTSLYTIGYLAEYEEIRTLKVSRIQDLKLTRNTFKRPVTFSLQAYTQGSFGIMSSNKPIKIKISFSGWAAINVREQLWHPSQTIIKDTEDELVAQFELTDTNEFKRWVLGYGRLAKVLQPKSLASEIKDELKSNLKLYQD